ncbi:beta-glucosidase BglX [Simiduia agarivorans]|uniref:beta-glucosidase n=1 Tax=Simiduia agarivorans (strain DSM 21679 / JCM 13881 / BCRC 17597 / SA1) TaxID=1117647 RepID=K4KJW8_SIMAS|nr:beta-glucosidase BglX [Simiduia agarivorans]AFU98525.2 b-glucosidase [Simiduia agarivorans SA1 = DSM 21679]
MKTARYFFVVLVVGVLGLVGLSGMDASNKASPDPIDAQVEALLGKLTLEEKIGQLSLRDWSMASTQEAMTQTLNDVKAGRVGGFLNVSANKLDPDAFAKLQAAAVEGSRMGIPLLFGQDVIHGYKTIFPIPLGQAASWNPELVQAGARVAAQEASSVGIRWTFAPMIDISRDARWGRIAESLGEDPLLTGRLGAAMVKGFQTDDLSSPTALAATAKHFAAYGAGEAGRDYATVNVPLHELRNIYLPPFKDAVDAGLVSIMTSYSTLNGVAATGNRFLMTDVLRGEWRFPGFVVSDWNAVKEMIPHGVAADDREAAALAFNAGVDFEMYTQTYEQQLPQLIQDGVVSIQQVDNAVRNMLKAKIQLGLFETPMPAAEVTPWLKADYLEAARQAARESFVLLEHRNGVLPLKPSQRIALVGPLADVPHEQLGTWIYDGSKDDSHSLLPALTQRIGDAQVKYLPTLENSRDHSQINFQATRKALAEVDVILYLAGEESILSGEGHSRGDISLPGAQQPLLDLLVATGKPVVMVIMAGRPVALDGAEQKVDALMMAWHPGTMAGPALVDVLYGDVSPKGRLPLTWPVSEGQIPIYYNHLATGRPATDDNYTRMQAIEQGVFQHAPGNSSNHLDYGHRPQYPFGYGLTYSAFEYSDLTLSGPVMKADQSITVSATITNTGAVAAEEVVQLYVRDKVASIARPVRELKDFVRVQLAAGESTRVQFELTAQQLAFFGEGPEPLLEPGQFDVWVAPHAEAGLQAGFELR